MCFFKTSIVCLLLSASFHVYATGDLPKRFAQNAKLGKGINTGNALEAPVEGEWGVIIEERFFKLIADKGFNSVRIPVNWSTPNRTEIGAPYEISAQLFTRVDQVIKNALKNRLSVVICMHHYNELYANPMQHKHRFLAIWDQISRHYKNESDSLYFELLNEPHDSLNASVWNGLFAEVLATVRKDNPTRSVIVGPANYNDLNQLNQLVLPGDSNLILTVHDYLPFQFTHQGAEWVEGSNAWLGTTWDNLESQRKRLDDGLAVVKAYADLHQLPVYVGEFGAYSKGDYYSRCQWTNFMAKTMEGFGFSWAYWEFCWGFGLYNDTTRTWREELTNALLIDPVYPAVQTTFGNNLTAGDFNSGLSPWALYVRSTAAAYAQVVNQKCHVVITALGTEPYFVQLTRLGLTFEKGKNYEISFMASSSEEKSITAYTAMNSSPWTNISNYETFTVTNTPQTFRFNFLMSGETDNKARFSLDLGSTLSDIYLYNVEIREIIFGVAGIRLESKGNATSIENGTSLQFFAKVYPVNASDKSILWSVENGTGKAVISGDGLLSAQSEGTVTVIAKSDQNPGIGETMNISITRKGSGIDEKKESKGFIYPNPATGEYLYVQKGSAWQNQRLEVSVFDLTGKALYRGIFETGPVKIPIRNFSEGFYLINIRDNEGVTYIKSIISRFR